MPEAFYALAVLACPVGMGLMMWFMMRGGKRSGSSASDEQPASPSASDAEVTALRAEVDQLRAEHRDGYRPGDAGAHSGGTESR